MREALIGLAPLGATAGESAILAEAKDRAGTTPMELNACAHQDFQQAYLTCDGGPLDRPSGQQ